MNTANVRKLAAVVAAAAGIARNEAEAAEIVAARAVEIAAHRAARAAELSAIDTGPLDETEAEKLRLAVINLNNRAARLRKLGANVEAVEAFARIFAHSRAVERFDSAQIYAQDKIVLAVIAVANDAPLHSGSIIPESLRVLARDVLAAGESGTALKVTAQNVNVVTGLHSGETQTGSASNALEVLGLIAKRRIGRAVYCYASEDKRAAELLALLSR